MKNKNTTENDTRFIKRVAFNKDFRSFKSKEIIEFKSGINLIVGDQGCGKSSLFYSLLNWQESGISMEYDRNKGYLFFDTETMNPRLETSFKAHKEFGSVNEYEDAKVDNLVARVADYDFKSHGQVMLPLILAHKETFDKTIFIDEPEAGLSIRSQFKVFNHYKELAKNNQLIIATHSLVLIKEIGEVCSLEHKKWMTADEFLETQTT